MKLRTIAALATLFLPAALLAQSAGSSGEGRYPTLNSWGSGVEDAFAVSYASQLNNGDSVVEITNAGTAAAYNLSGAATSTENPTNTPGLGDICVNIYVFNPDEELEACCSCRLTPNELQSWAYISTINGAPGLLSNPGVRDVNTSSAVIKLVATNPNITQGTSGTTTAQGCNNTPPTGGKNRVTGNVTATQPITASTLAPGLVAYTTHAHVTNGPMLNNGNLPVNITETPFLYKGLSQGEANFLTSSCANFLGQSGQGFCGCPTADGGYSRLR
jgi:hypothetical protein